MTRAGTRTGSSTSPVFVLAAQGFALGITTAWVTIPASAIFLASYGPGLLPVTYIGAAVAGIVSSAGLAAAFRRTAVVSVAKNVLFAVSLSLLASWAVLSLWDADWVSFGLLALVPLMVPVGFIFVVGQAGMLLDVRALKASYARVVAGFALGFVTGGLAGPPLLTLFGPTRSLLAIAALSSAAFLGLVVRTRRRYPAELAVVEDTGSTEERPTLRALSRNRYVMLIVAFQMLSAVESQWLDFNVLASAAQRYHDSDALARFVSQFTAVAYGADILFLLVLAGFLLHRFGLRYGLTANAIGVLAAVGGIIVAGSSVGMGATIVFALVISARVVDLTLSDGSSRTSLSAAYQAMPARQRAVTQATVEGLAVPVAIGASGLVLLAIPSTSAADNLVPPALTLLVVIAWTVVAILLYRHYRVSLLANLRGRTLDGTELTVDEASVQIALGQLLESRDERDVRLGLDLLTSDNHPELPTRLEHFAADARPTVRVDALERLARLDSRAAAAVARRALDDPSTDMVVAGLRTLGFVGDDADLPDIAAYWNRSDTEVKVAAATALSRLGDDVLRTEVATEIRNLGRSTAAHDRMLAAKLLGGVSPRSPTDRRVLRALLDDPDPRVVTETLDALRSPEDADLASEIARHLEDRRTAGAARDALVRLGDAALVVIEADLRAERYNPACQELLVHACREIGGRSAVALLQGHVQHRYREVGLAVMRALAGLAVSGEVPADLRVGPSDETADLVATVVRSELEHAAHALRALIAFEDEPAAFLQSRALRDELDLIRARILAAFSMRHGVEGFSRVVHQLVQRDSRFHALALEWLDVTLIGDERASVALLDPRLSDRDRLAVILRTFALPMMTQRETLLELVEDRDGRWRRPWVKACALYTASRMSRPEFEVIADACAADEHEADDPIVPETLVGIRSRLP